MTQMRIGGLASGMDIDSIVEKLMQAERLPLDKLEQQKQTYEWTRDAYRDVNTKLQTFDTYIADNLLLKSFNTKTASSSNSSLVEATATGSATGTLSIEGVSQLAVAARSIGGQVNAIGTTTLGDLFANSGVSVNQNYIEIRAIQKDGTLASQATRIDFTEQMTINEFVSKINRSAAGVSAIFENGRLSITANNTGEVKDDAEIKVDSGQAVFEAFKFEDTTNLANNGKNAIFQVNGIATERASNSFSISGYNVTLKNTFNGVQTIAEKYTAAQKEQELSGINFFNKTLSLNDEKHNYYGVGNVVTLNYTDAHNNAYVDAFGDTLNLSQQEIFNKLGSAFWRGLSDEVIDFISNNNLKTAFEGSNYTNLKSLSYEQINTLANLTDAELETYRSHANNLTSEQEEKFNKLGSTFWKVLSDDEIEFIINNKSNLKLAIEESDYTNLKKLSDDQIETLAGAELSNVEIKTYQLHANNLSLSQEEIFNKLGNEFWKDLSDEEIGFITSKASDFKSAIKESNYSNLIGLSDDQISTLNLTKTEIENYQLHANYQVYGTKLKDFDADTIHAIQNFAFDSDDELSKIQEDIKNNPDFSDEVKDVLTSLNKEELTNLLSTSPATLAIYQQKAQADDLKSKYNILGDSFFNDLTPQHILDISDIDFTEDNAISSITDETLRNKLEGLNESQIKALGSLSAPQLNNFKALATQNIKRSDYTKVNAELKAAESRFTTAKHTLETAKIDAQDADILNDDGTINNDAVSGAGTTNPVTLTSTTNVDEIIDKIKDFVKTYNGLITELNNLTKEQKYRDYQPLTKAQRDELDEKEIERWEEKAKSGLLRSDSILREGISKMRSLVYQSNPAVSNPKFNTLFSIGITTTKNYNDGGTLEIDENKLRKALEEDPDAVTALFTNNGRKEDKVIENGVEKTIDSRGYLQKLRDEMTNIKNKIEKKAGRSTMTENQYTIGKSLRDIEKRISTWTDKLKNIEDRYWKQFTAMEKAINKANMQASMFMPQM